MNTVVKTLATALLATVLISSCGPSGPEPPAEVEAPLEGFFQAALKGDMSPGIELIEPVWLETYAKAAGVSVDEYKTDFAQRYNGEISNLGLTSYKLWNRKQVSETEWEIEVRQDVKEGLAIDTSSVIKVGDKWYVAGKNFD